MSTPEAQQGPELIESLKQRIRELERELELHAEFVSVVGHELRNPISPAFLHVQRLLSQTKQAEQGVVQTSWLVPQLEAFERRLLKLLSVLNRMLDVSRLSTGRIELVLEEVDLADLVRDSAASFERELAAARSTLSLELPEHLRGRWDRLRLEQIVCNLLSNAIRYGAGQPIEVQLEAQGAQAVLHVRDHGIGIDEHHQQRIFQRFERIGGERYRGGFGVGLWLVHQLCCALGGSVRVDSRVGAGATFTVVLPLRVQTERDS